MSARPPREPWLASRLARLLVRGEQAEFVLGDLCEDFRRIAERDGLGSARRWYRGQLLRLAARGLVLGPRRPAETYVRDLRHAARALRLAPTYTLGTILTLAVGIGGATTVAAMAESVLRPLPFPDSERLVAVWETREGNQRSVAPANYLDWRRTATSFDGLAAHDTRSVSLTVAGVASRGTISFVSGNFFDVLGTTPSLGRTFDPVLNTAFGARLAVLSHAGWRELFGARPDVLGRTLQVDEVTYEVVGVMPDGVDLPAPDVVAWLRSRTEAPEVTGFDGDLSTLRDAWYFEVVGRLADGATVDVAAAEMATIAQRLSEAYPVANRRAGARVIPLLEQSVAGFDAMLLALALVVGLVLIGAGANVTHLVLARSAARSRDVGVKRALGATRGDIRRGMLMEGALLGLGGAGLGIVVASALLRSPLVEGDWIPRAGEIGLRPGVVALALGLGLIVGCWVAFTADLRSRRPSGTIARGPGGTGPRGGRVMIAGQVAVAVALVVGTALLGRSLAALGAVDLGFSSRGLATVRIAMPDARARAYEERVAEYDRVLDEIRRVPGVELAGMGSTSPLSQGLRAGVRVVGEEREGDPPDSGWQPVAPGYLETIGAPLLAGRAIVDTDTRESVDVAVVNEAFVSSVLGGGDPLGVEVTIGLDGHDRPLTIVGVVADTRSRGPGAPPGPVIFRPMAQTVRFEATAVFVAARTSQDPDRTLASIRSAVRAAAPGLPVYDEALGEDLARPFRRAQSALLGIVGVFATTALLLGAVGVYAVAAYGVRRRRREIGVRLALGADTGRVAREVLSAGLKDALWGVPLGIALAVLMGRALESVLFGVGGTDVPTLAGAVSAVLAVSGAALYGPGRTAARTDPSGAMRDG